MPYNEAYYPTINLSCNESIMMTAMLIIML